MEQQLKERLITELLTEKKITADDAYNLLNDLFFNLKPTIVQRLLDKNDIGAEQAILLLKDNHDKNILSNENILFKEPEQESFAEKCSCNPKNGGSGVCGCTMGNKFTLIC